MKYAVTVILLLLALPVYGQSPTRTLDEEKRELIRDIENYLGLGFSAPQPAVRLTSNLRELEEKVEDCKIVMVTVGLLGERMESEITPDLAVLILNGLTRTCGFMRGHLRREVMLTRQRGEITEEKAVEYYKVISAAELVGPQYQAILRRARSSGL